MKNLIRNIELNPTVADNHLRLIEEYRRNHGNSLVLEQLYEGALSECGLHPSEGPIVWSDYRGYLNKLDDLCLESRVKRIRYLFYRQMSLPLSGLPDLFDEYRLWEEELSEKSSDSLNKAKEHFIKGQQEWNLRKAYETKIHTDNVSNIQELFDAWMLYINFEKDKMISIEYSSKIEHNVSDSYPATYMCNKEDSLTEYKYDPRDSVIMVYRRALDDLGSLRIDLWFEFANFISTTYNCPHMLSNVYYSSLKHFEKNLKLWVLYLRTLVEAAKDRMSHHSLFGHHYTPGCKTRSSSVWYPLNEEILCLSGEMEIRDFYLSKIIDEFGITKELFKSMKTEIIEIYTVVVDLILDLVKFEVPKQGKNNDLCKNDTEMKSEDDIENNNAEGDSQNNCFVEHSEKYMSFKDRKFAILRDIYLEGHDVIIEIFKENGQTTETESLLTEESVLMFYSQWMNFELMNPEGVLTLISVIEKIVNSFESQPSKLLSLVFSVAKEKFGNCDNFRSKMEDLASKRPEEICFKIMNAWENSVVSSILIEGFEKRKSELMNSNVPSPLLSHIPSSASNSRKNDSSFPFQDLAPSNLFTSNRLQYLTESQKLQFVKENAKSIKDKNEGDFVCLSEIRFRRDKRRFRRNFPESDYDASSECSSESNSVVSSLIQSHSGIGNKMVRNFTPPGTPNNMNFHNAISNVSANGNLTSCSFVISPCSPGYNSGYGMCNNYGNNSSGFQKTGMQTAESIDISTTGGGTSLFHRSPFGGGGSLSDLELRTQCTWDGREAIEPSIAPPIPPIPTLSSMSSVSSSSSHSSYNKKSSKFSIQPLCTSEANSTERYGDESAMPPPSYTPKKSRVENKSGVDGSLFQSSASENSDFNIFNNSIDNFSRKGEKLDLSEKKDELPVVVGNNTLFVRFPSGLEMNEELILSKHFEKYSRSIRNIRIVKNIHGRNKGFAYIDLESNESAKEVICDCDLTESLSSCGISVFLSDSPKQPVACDGVEYKKKSNRLENSQHRFKGRKRRQMGDEERKYCLNSTILVKNIDKSLDDKSIVDHFQNCLDIKVKNISLSKDDKGNSRGFAFIEFFTPNDALTAHMLNESKLGSSSITVNSSTRPFTVSKSNKYEKKGGSLNARLAPRTKSKRKLPIIDSRDTCTNSELNNSEQVSTSNKDSLTNEDFRRIFSFN